MNEKTTSAGLTAVSAESYLAEHVRLAHLEDDAPLQDEQLLYDRTVAAEANHHSTTVLFKTVVAEANLYSTTVLAKTVAAETNCYSTTA